MAYISSSLVDSELYLILINPLPTITIKILSRTPSSVSCPPSPVLYLLPRRDPLRDKVGGGQEYGILEGYGRDRSKLLLYNNIITLACIYPRYYIVNLSI